MMLIEPLRFHGPGWRMTDVRDLAYEFTVWAPREDEREPNSRGVLVGQRGRDYWQAHWCDDRGWDGDLRQADSLVKVLAIFPSKVAVEFTRVIDDWTYGTVVTQWRNGQLVAS